MSGVRQQTGAVLRLGLHGQDGVTHREDAAETALPVAYGVLWDRFYCHSFVGRVVSTQHEVDAWETAILAREQREESQRASPEERVAAVAGQ